jgi:CubicO group peptidase (beta-lactamase class C family)
MSFTQRDAARLRDTAARMVEEHNLPGLAIGIVSREGLVFSEAFGYADIESKAPMTPERRQRIASITKTMVALCAMALVDEGRLSLDARVAELLDDIPFQGPFENLTIRHLLTHTGGIGEAPDTSQLADPLKLLFGPASQTLAEGYADGFTIEVPPGTKWAYANHGYFLLGEIVSRTEAAALPEIASRRIFEPLGMRDTDMLDRHHPDLSTGYHRAPGEDERALLMRAGREVPDEPTVDGTNIRGEVVQEWGRGAAGGVQSTVPDMARYAAALLKRSGGIVEPETFDLMTSRQWDPHSALQAWGLGFAVRTSFGQRSFGHGGNALGGWNSHLGIYPDDGLATIIHTNVTFPQFSKMTQRIKQAALGAADFAVPSTQADPSLLTAAPGVYQATLPGPLTNFRIMTEVGRLQVTNRDGALVLHSRRGAWKRGVQLVPTGEPGVFALNTGDPDPGLLAFQRGGGGAITGLHVSDGAPWYLERAEGIEPWA